MTKSMAFYHGNMASSDICWVIDRTGLICGSDSITKDPVPICEPHARELKNKLKTALKEVQP